jgi:hypothetical protein
MRSEDVPLIRGGKVLLVAAIVIFTSSLEELEAQDSL